VEKSQLEETAVSASDNLLSQHLLGKMFSSSSSSAAANKTSPNIFFLLLILSSTSTLASHFDLTPQWKPVNRTHLALSATIPEYASNIHAIGLHRKRKFIARSAIPERGKEQLVKFVAKMNPCSTYQPFFAVYVAFKGRGAEPDYHKISSMFGYTPLENLRCSDGQLVLETKESGRLGAGVDSENRNWWVLYAAIGGALLLLLFIIGIVGCIVCCRKRSPRIEVAAAKYESWNTEDFDGKTAFMFRKTNEKRKNDDRMSVEVWTI